MQLARIIGRATSTVKHRSLSGAKLLIAQTVSVDRKLEGDPLLVVDRLGAGHGDLVLITSDGLGLRQLLNDDNSPARWWTLGIVDHAEIA
ncbi:MAG: EutN/CcmL family microcompartment protein [Phycisphaeraceae bacterium]|nr:EutN/CcmL family microcompartment protein [Phycisphaeraceae bacterium]